MKYAAIALLLLSGCQADSPATIPASSTQATTVAKEQDLAITFGGFLKDGPESEKVDGVCSTNQARTTLDCDIYNGLPGWTLTEVTVGFVWSPFDDNNNHRELRNSVEIMPLTTGHISMRLGMQLPADNKHWSWQIIAAKGRKI